DATISHASSPSANHASGVSRRCPLRRPTVCRISRSMPMNVPRPRRIFWLVRAFIVRWNHRDSAPGVPGWRAARRFVCRLVVIGGLLSVRLLSPVTLGLGPSGVLRDSCPVRGSTTGPVGPLRSSWPTRDIPLGGALPHRALCSPTRGLLQPHVRVGGGWMRKRSLLGLIAATVMAGTCLASSPVAADSPGNHLYRPTTQNESNAYARVIRLQHAGELNGRLLATFEHWFDDGSPAEFIIRASDDDGRTWTTLTTVPDPLDGPGHPVSR